MTTRINLIKSIGKVLIFILLVCSALYFVQKPLLHDQDNKKFQHVKGFYAEERNKLDAVYIGASNVYPWYEPPVAWHNYGIRSFDFSVPLMPSRAVRYFAEEALKTQPDALLVININSFKDVKLDYRRVHIVADNMKFSGTKVNMINDLCEHADEPIEAGDRMEFFFPMIRFHSGWSGLDSEHFVRKVNGLKGGEHDVGFFSLSQDISEKARFKDKRVKASEEQIQALDELVGFLKERKAKALFVFTPQMLKKSVTAQLGYLLDRAEKQGCDVLDLVSEKMAVDTIGLDYSEDLYDNYHTNVHGAIKYTGFLADYIQKRYSIEDRRGDSGTADWDEAVKKYFGLISPYTLDFERDLAKRTLELTQPETISFEAGKKTISIKWSPVEGAGGYAIYRKKLINKKEETTTDWEKIKEVDSSTVEYNDDGLKGKKTYYYTVVPVRNEGGDAVYGCFNYSGVSARTLG